MKAVQRGPMAFTGLSVITGHYYVVFMAHVNKYMSVYYLMYAP